MSGNPAFLAFCIRMTVGLLAALAIIQFMIVPTLHAAFRQRVFSLRRELFLFMADGNVSASDPVYAHLWARMNGVLRFAERLSLLRILFLGLVLIRRRAGEFRHLERLLGKVSDAKLREHLSAFDDRLAYEIARHTLLTSPTAWILGAVVIPILVVIHCMALP